MNGKNNNIEPVFVLCKYETHTSATMKTENHLGYYSSDLTDLK